jgi:D-alanyl-D-alanine carboxypeptidase (penicillin-binding protein 5/6)
MAHLLLMWSTLFFSLRMKSYFLRFSLLLQVIGLVSCTSTPSVGPGTTSYPGNYSGNYPAPAPAPVPTFRPNSPPPVLRCGSYIMIDANTGRTLAASGADTPRQVASTQKLLTALVVTKSGNLDRNLRVEPSDIRVEPTKLGLRVGEVISRRQLIYAFLVKSGNDGANALARDNAGSNVAFAKRMNGLARYLGATNSNFITPHGLHSSGQHSTARDMSRIALAAYRDPTIRDAVRRGYTTFHGHSLRNTNELLVRMSECDGMKTGYTSGAGKCLISSAQRGGRAVILVQLGSHIPHIWSDGQAMMNWGLSNL